MMFGPTIPMLLLALPVLASVIVVFAGFLSLFMRTPQPSVLPRAIALPMATPRVPRVAMRPHVAVPHYEDDEQTVVFHRPIR